VTPRARGFTLLELMVALALSGIVMVAVAGVMIAAKRQAIRNEARAVMSLESAFVSQLLAEDLRAGGLGVPGAGNVSVNGVGPFAGVVLAANPASIMVLGDRPRPDAQYNTFSLLNLRETGGGSSRHFYMLNESNGACAPENGSTNCSIGDHSLFFPGIGNVCDTTAAAWFGPAGRACPWGMKRLRGGESFQIVANSGEWANLEFEASLHDHDIISMIGTNGTAPPGWGTAMTDMPLAAGQGWVTTLDRVVWRFDAGTNRLVRNQCWGPAQPADGAWANVAAPAGVPGATCTGEEVMLENVESVAFSYFDGTGAPATDADIDRVEWAVTLRRDFDTKSTRHTFRGAAGIRNAFQ
jgi:prepilin-type N-terminal cleavage/methylation domain-containing protein